MIRDSVKCTSVLVLVAIATAGLLSVDAVAQTGDDGLRFFQRFPGVTATSIGLAGTGIAGVGDPAALLINPAGLGLARTSSISGSFSSFDTKDESFFVVPGSEFAGESSVRNTGIGNLSSLYKVPTSQGSLVLAISFAQTSSYERQLLFEGENGSNSITDYFMPLSGEFEMVQDGADLYPDFFRTQSFIAYETFAIDFDQGLYDSGNPVPFLPAVSAGTVAQIGTTVEEGRMSELNFGMAVEASKDVLMGVSINIPFSRYTFSRDFEEDDIYNDNDGNNGTTDFSYLDYSEWFQSDIVGINARLGVSALLSPRVRLGATIETPTYLTIEDEYETILYTEFDNGDVFEYGAEFEQDAGSGFYEYEILTPWRAGVGLSYRTSSLTLLGDIEMVDWSQMEFRSDDASFTDVNRAITTSFDPVANVRLGASYEAGDFIVRGGLAVYPDPRTESYLADPSGSSIDRDRKFISIGVGYRFSRDLRLDLGWMQERYEDLYRPYTEVGGAPWVEEDVVRNRFQLGISVTM